MAEVVTGPRGPDKPGERDEKPTKVAAKADSSEIVYESAVKNYRIQITSPFDIVDPAKGRVTPAKPLVAQFRDFVFIADSSKEHGPEIIEELDRVAGLGKKIWRQTEMTEAVAAAKDKEIRDFVTKQHEKVAMMLQEIVGAKGVASLAKK